MEAYIGEIRHFAFTFAPPGWMACDGALMAIAQNAALFSLLGTTYGGDGTTSFALPTIASADGQPKANICVNGIYPARS